MTTVDINQVARNFVQFYYQTFTSNRAGLGALYGLPIFKVEPQIDTLDAQPSISGAILIFITGRLMIDNESMPQRFSQTFQLLPASGSFFVHNDIFRLNYG